MSWTEELYKVYENNCGVDRDEMQLGETDILLPVSHSTANAQIEVTVDEAGNFVSAVRIDNKADALTIIPVTEDSGARGAGVMPHPLADKLLYIAGDYGSYAAGKRSDNQKYYQAYMSQLKQWKDSAAGHPAVTAIWTYLAKAGLMKDLTESRVLTLDTSTGRLADKEKILGIAQEDAFVRFRVNYQELFRENRTWKDDTLYDSFIQYNSETAGERQLCYATGRMLPATYKHPAKIRNAGDKAKLISSNDESGFTYRGRFDAKEQALSVSYDFSQKMHNALKWLIARQGVAVGSLMILVWESHLQALPNILGNPEVDEREKLLSDEADDWDEWDDWEESDREGQAKAIADTMPAYRQRLRKIIWGNSAHFEIKSKAMVMGLDAATTGRLSVALYSEMATSEFLSHIEKWYAETAWLRFIPKEKRTGIHSFSLYEIAECAFGTEQGDFIKCKDEVRNDTICRLIPCVVDKRRLPEDVVNSLVIKASKPLAYNRYYNWRKVLECACGMVRKKRLESRRWDKMKEEETMAVNRACTERDYLYGRLLAVADAAEAFTYDKADERVTNARRYFESFANRPYQTWGVIENRLRPYLDKMSGGARTYYEKLMGEIMDKFDLDDYRDNTKLKPEYLLAYHCQLNEIYGRNNKKEQEDK